VNLDDDLKEMEFETVQEYMTDRERVAFEGEDLPLLWAFAVLRNGTADYWAETRKQLAHAMKKSHSTDPEVHDASRTVDQSLERSEARARYAALKVAEAGYDFDPKTNHVVSRTGDRGKPPRHFRALVWRMFNKLYPYPREEGDWSMNTAEAREELRELLFPHFPEEWLDTNPRVGLYRIIDAGLNGKL
jgi:hypothetical protein